MFSGQVAPNPAAPAHSARQIHTAVTRSAHRLELLHADALQCRRGCYDCCVDNITVFEIEAARIIASHAQLLAHARPHPIGACAFLDQNGGCRIYPQRPYVCRTQGLPLRWLDTDPEGHTNEYRDICPLNDHIPLTQLPPEACWTLGRTEKLLRQAQQQHGGTLRRVALRALFKRGSPTSLSAHNE